MRSALGHPPPATTGTDRPSLAGKGNQTIQATPVATKAREPAREESTAQKALELLLNEPGQPLSVAETPGLRAKAVATMSEMKVYL
jgi:hypothetical protein